MSANQREDKIRTEGARLAHLERAEAITKLTSMPAPLAIATAMLSPLNGVVQQIAAGLIRENMLPRRDVIKVMKGLSDGTHSLQDELFKGYTRRANDDLHTAIHQPEQLQNPLNAMDAPLAKIERARNLQVESEKPTPSEGGAYGSRDNLPKLDRH